MILLDKDKSFLLNTGQYYDRNTNKYQAMQVTGYYFCC